MNIPDPVFKVGQKVRHTMYAAYGISTIIGWSYVDGAGFVYNTRDERGNSRQLAEVELVKADDEISPRLKEIIEAAYSEISNLITDLNDLMVVLPADRRYRAAEEKQDAGLIFDYLHDLRKTYCQKVSNVGK